MKSGIQGDIMKKRIKAWHGWYKSVKYLERHMKWEEEANNWRRMHGMPPRRRTEI